MPRSHARWLLFLPALCGNAIDDDGDALVDLADPGCTSATDVTEWSPAGECVDGIDNDGDAKIDLIDPDCSFGHYDREKRKKSCGVGIELLALGLLPRLSRAIRTASAPSPTRRAASRCD